MTERIGNLYWLILDSNTSYLFLPIWASTYTASRVSDFPLYNNMSLRALQVLYFILARVWGWNQVPRGWNKHWKLQSTPGFYIYCLISRKQREVIYSYLPGFCWSVPLSCLISLNLEAKCVRVCLCHICVCGLYYIPIEGHGGLLT